jgi:hypothetical protein
MRLLIALLFSINLFASEFVFNKEFSKDVKASILQMSMTIETFSKFSEKDIFVELSKFSDFVENYKNDIEYYGGNFRVYPEYIYNKGQKNFQGYRGNLQYQFHSKDNDGIEKLLKDIATIKKQKTTHYQINQISWIADPKLSQRANDALRDDVIVWSSKYAQELSKKLNQKCIIKNIDFSNKVRVSNTMKRASLESIPNVQQPDYKASISPTITVECK